METAIARKDAAIEINLTDLAFILRLLGGPLLILGIITSLVCVEEQWIAFRTILLSCRPISVDIMDCGWKTKWISDGEAGWNNAACELRWGQGQGLLVA